VSELKHAAWWDRLSVEEQRAARAVAGELPAWMVTSMLAAGLHPVEALLADGAGGYRLVMLPTTTFAAFLDRQGAAAHPTHTRV